MSVIGLDRPVFPVEEASVQKVVDYWTERMDLEIGNRPDLVVLPECCDTVPTENAADKARWIRLKGSRVLEAMKAYAARHACYVVFPTHRVRDDGRFANSSILIDRQGKVLAVYDKMFPTIGEMTSVECPVVPGKNVVVAETDFGKLGFAICFDLNFDEVKQAYREARPDIICFSSYFDGDFLQREWAFECRAYVVSSTCRDYLAKRIVDPSGTLMRNESYYCPTFTTKINMNCQVLHLDKNRDKFGAIVKKYGRGVEIRNPGTVGVVTLLSNDASCPVENVIREFGLETLDEYLARTAVTREGVLKRISEGVR